MFKKICEGITTPTVKFQTDETIRFSILDSSQKSMLTISSMFHCAGYFSPNRILVSTVILFVIIPHTRVTTVCVGGPVRVYAFSIYVCD